MKYRKKPVVIEAQQWFPPGNDGHHPSMLSDRKGNTVDPPDYRQVGDLYLAFKADVEGQPDTYMIKTLEGSLKVSPGDWIITGVKGEKYPCKPDIFDQTYTPAGGDEDGIVNLTVCIDENSDECLYIDGKAWPSTGEVTVYSCDIDEYAKGRLIRFNHQRIDSLVSKWPPTLEEAMALSE